MSASLLTTHQLPTRIYRKFLLITSAWPGARAEPNSLLIKVYNGKKENAPLYWVGTPEVLDSFNQQFHGERSIYCISTTWEVINPTKININTLAAYYAAEIIKVQPTGGYLLGGFCEGGLITFEIAKILTEQGYKIDLLTFCERDLTKRSRVINFARKLFHLKEGLDRRMVHLKVDPWQCIKEFTYYKIIQLKAFLAHLLSFIYKSKKTLEPEEPRYQLSPYPEKIYLIYIKWGLLGYFRFTFFQKYWDKIALGGARFWIIEGRQHNHPNWKKVAKIVKDQIDEISQINSHPAH